MEQRHGVLLHLDWANFHQGLSKWLLLVDLNTVPKGPLLLELPMGKQHHGLESRPFKFLPSHDCTTVWRNFDLLNVKSFNQSHTSCKQKGLLHKMAWGTFWEHFGFSFGKFLFIFFLSGFYLVLPFWLPCKINLLGTKKYPKMFLMPFYAPAQALWSTLFSMTQFLLHTVAHSFMPNKNILGLVYTCVNSLKKWPPF